ncbi:MAG: ASCH domain-containing protein [Planctomycetia bacterium]|nr:ASCH domain-containing protein [Planctomycetia bacterium]
MLLFKKKFLDLIREGKKTQTVRIWPKRRLKVSQKEFIPGLGKVQITGFEPISVDDLTEADAQADGFDTLEALLGAIKEMYGEDLKSLPCFKITFHLLPESS